MNVTTYKDYFRTLAILNKKLLHDPASELPEAEPGLRHFTFFNQGELISNKLRNQLSNDAVLHLHMYDWTQSDNQAYDVRMNYDAGFIVSQHAAPNNEAQMEAAYANTEAIVMELLAKMQADYWINPQHCGLPFGKPDFTKMQVTAVGPLWDGRYGWFVSYPFEVRADGSPAAYKAIAAAAFNDSALTHNLTAESGDPLTTESGQNINLETQP